MTVVNNHIEHERILKRPPVIRPVASGIARPLWSVMIPAFNCGAFLKMTLESVIRQDLGPDCMQIEVIDDCSTDMDVEQLVRQVGQGRISYYRQPRNMGSLRNFHTCIERATGHLVHILHGDDVVRNGFYISMQNIFQNHREIGAAFCRYAYINETNSHLFYHDSEMDEPGVLPNWLERISERQRIQYAAMVVKRDVYEKLGGFYGVEYGEDWEMWVRIAAHYPVGYTPEVLAEYRKHLSSISGRSFLSGKNMEELEFVMENISQYLPPSKRDTILKKSQRFYAHYAMHVANGLWKAFRHKEGVMAQVRAAWRMQKDILLLFKILKLYTRITFHL